VNVVEQTDFPSVARRRLLATPLFVAAAVLTIS
jgi:hypothetical protein